MTGEITKTLETLNEDTGTVSFGLQDEAELETMKILQSDAPTAEKKGALVEAILQRWHIKTLDDSEEILRYQSGIFEKGVKNKIVTELEHFGGHLIDNHMRHEVIESIKARTFTTRTEFDAYPGWIHVGNGWVNYLTKEFKDNSPAMLSLHKVPWDYDIDAKNTEQQKFFADIFEEDDIPVVRKFFGYLLLPDQRYKKAFLGIGPKDTGKSKFAELVERFAGQVSHVSLRDMDRLNHNVAKITDSIVNTVSEMPKYKLKDVSLFKAITGGDEVTFREIYGKPYSTKVGAKILVVANDKPNFDEMDRTFIERWIVFEFTNVFTAGADMDVNIMEKLTTPEEMSGLLNFALAGLEELLKDGYFKLEAWDDVKADWDSLDGKITDYKNNHCKLGSEYSILVEDLFEDYKSKGGNLTKSIFGRELKKLGVLPKQVNVGDRRPYAYTGITTNERFEKGYLGYLGNFGTLVPYVDGTKEGGYVDFPKMPKTEDAQA